MKVTVVLVIICFAALISQSGCKSFIGIQTATALGATGGEAVGEVFGKASGNETAGAVIGASLGEVTGSVIGIKMDRQAADIKKDVSSAKVNRVGDGIVVEFSSKILFQSNHSDLSSAAQKNLDGLVNIFKKYPDTHLEIHGHTDDKGTADYNQSLSEKRATAVAIYLENQGIDTARISTKGLGNTLPKYKSLSEKERSQNRRVEVMISSK